MKRFNIGYLYIVLCASIFSFVEVALKATSGMFHPMQITVLRFLIGGAVLLPVALGVMPALMSSTDLSFCGTREKLDKRRCPLLSKKVRNFSRSSFRL